VRNPADLIPRTPVRCSNNAAARSRSTAYGVELKEPAWQGEASKDLTVHSEMGKRFATIAPGATATHSYVLAAGAPGVLEGPPAQVTYRPSVTSEEERVCFSTGFRGIVISVTDSRLDTLLWLGTYGTLGLLQSYVAWRNAIVLIVTVSAVLIGTHQYKSMVERRKRRKQIRYEQEFMAEK